MKLVPRINLQCWAATCSLRSGKEFSYGLFFNANQIVATATADKARMAITTLSGGNANSDIIEV